MNCMAISLFIFSAYKNHYIYLNNSISYGCLFVGYPAIFAPTV